MIRLHQTLTINPIAPTPPNAPVVVTGTASDTGSGVANVKVKLDSGSYVVASGTTNWSTNIELVSTSTCHMLTVNATDNAGNSNVQTPSFCPFIIQFDHPSYTVGDNVLITVTDASANTNNSALDHISVQVTSDSDPVGFTTTLTETEQSTGIFTSTAIKLSAGPTTPSDDTLHIDTSDMIHVEYKSNTTSVTVH